MARGQPQRLVWATRGRFWGFRFLLKGGFADPLQAYERSFAGIGDAPTACQRAGETTAFRFPDPLGRRDASGRVIPHEFVVFGELADEVESAADGLTRVWPLVSEIYADIWDSDGAPLVPDDIA